MARRFGRIQTACLTGSRAEFPVGSSRPLPWLLIVPFLGRDAFRRRTLLGARKEIWARAAPPPRHSAELFTFPLNKIGRSGSRRPGTGWERLTSVCDPVWATSVPCGAAETIITEFPVVLSTYPTASDPRPPNGTLYHPLRPPENQSKPTSTVQTWRLDARRCPACQRPGSSGWRPGSRSRAEPGPSSAIRLFCPACTTDCSVHMVWRVSETESASSSPSS